MKAGITEEIRKIVRKRFCQEVKGLELEEKGVEQKKKVQFSNKRFGKERVTQVWNILAKSLKSRFFSLV